MRTTEAGGGFDLVRQIEPYIKKLKLTLMKKTMLFLVCLMLASVAVLSAQNVQVSGIVTDDADRQPLPGVGNLNIFRSATLAHQPAPRCSMKSKRTEALNSGAKASTGLT
jgi:hypothetical protein